jgi:thioesterase domain-containing protein
METVDAMQSLNAQYAAMPPVAAMRLRAVAWDGTALRLEAPLAANVNDKGCAFGGSMASAMTLAGWGLLTLKLADAGIAAEVYVADSQLRYLKPLFADLVAEARLEPGTDWDAVLRGLRDRGRARAGLVARVVDAGGTTVAEFTGRFAALRGG